MRQDIYDGHACSIDQKFILISKNRPKNGCQCPTSSESRKLARTHLKTFGKSRGTLGDTLIQRTARCHNRGRHLHLLLHISSFLLDPWVDPPRTCLSNL
jgi:hypothetical protein